MFEGNKAEENGHVVWNHTAPDGIFIVVEIDQEAPADPHLLITIDNPAEGDGAGQILLNQSEALDLARLLKEFGVRGVLPEPPAPEPVAEPQEPQLPMATTQE